MLLTDLTMHLDALLEPWRFKDYAPNGLQVEGRAEVRRVVCGVTASQALIDAALAWQADAILVHHGYFWKGEDSRITGIRRQRLRSLLLNNISLLAYHLPLDAHAQVGNNAQLGRVLEIDAASAVPGHELLWQGQLPASCSAQELADMIAVRLGRRTLLLGDASRPVARVAWCTGGAQSLFEQAVGLGVDAYITGEVSEQNQHLAWESGCAFIAAGHHATERYGIEALALRLAAELPLAVSFVDLDNPV